MKEVDNLLIEGMAHYAEAMYAIRQFERSVEDIVGMIIEDQTKGRIADLLQLLEQKKLDGAHFGKGSTFTSSFLPFITMICLKGSSLDELSKILASSTIDKAVVICLIVLGIRE